MARTRVQWLPLKPGARYPSDMDRLGANLGELLMKILDAHRARILAKHRDGVCSEVKQENAA